MLINKKTVHGWEVYLKTCSLPTIKCISFLKMAGNDGFLVIANAETLKKEISFQDELNGKISWP